ncbi:MAG: TRAP transporter substrate-binding protein DctP [Magnetococcales bacterium]|nr:TRAP transporter substrate-binding protein DctP [Magnetococcales bacterium]
MKTEGLHPWITRILGWRHGICRGGTVGMSEKSVKRILIVLLLVVLGLLGERIALSLRDPEENLAVSQTTHNREITLRLGMATSVGPVPRAAAIRLAERLAALSHDTLKLTIHPASEFGGDERMLKLASRGELAMVLVTSDFLARRIEALRVFELPFLFPSRDALNRALDGEFGRVLLDKARHLNLEGLAFWDGGNRHLLADRPLPDPEAFADLRFVEPDSRVNRAYFARLGVQFVNPDDPLAQVWEQPLLGLENLSGRMTPMHLLLSGHTQMVHMLAMGRDAQDLLTARQQEILLEATREITWWTRVEQGRLETDRVKRLRGLGMSIHESTPEARESFRTRLLPVERRFEEDIGADVMAKLAEWQGLHDPESTRGDEVLIGLDAQLSGESAQAGLELSRAVRLAIETINDQGGVLGRKLRLVARDNHGLATRGLENLKFFARLDDLVAVVGGQKSSVVAAEVELVHELELPLLLPWSAARQLTENGFRPNQVFRLSLNDRWTAPFLADAALRRGKKIALVLENSSWGGEFEKIVSRHLNARGVRPVFLGWVDNGQEQFDTLVSRLGESGAEVVILVDTPDESVPLLMELRRHLPAMSVVSHWGLLGGEMTAMQRQVIGGMDLLFPQTGFPNEPNHRAGQAMLASYRRYLGMYDNEPVHVLVGFAQAFDLVGMLVEAMRASKSMERRAVRDALERLNAYDGVMKRLRQPFDEQRHDALVDEDYRLGRMTPEGVVVPAAKEGE